MTKYEKIFHVRRNKVSVLTLQHCAAAVYTVTKLILDEWGKIFHVRPFASLAVLFNCFINRNF